MALLNRRRAQAAPFDVPAGTKVVLHVGCGPKEPLKVPGQFRTPGWRELRLDIDPGVKPDIVSSIADMAAVPTDSVDALWSSHNLEHVRAHEVPVVLREFHRVLRPDGEVLIELPDLQRVAEEIVKGNLEGPFYKAAIGTIAALDVVYGLGTAIAEGNDFMAHRTGFTAKTLDHRLRDAGFRHVNVVRLATGSLEASARKPG